MAIDELKITTKRKNKLPLQVMESLKSLHMQVGCEQLKETLFYCSQRTH